MTGANHASQPHSMKTKLGLLGWMFGCLDSVRAEHGKHVMAGRQVCRGQPGRRRGDCPWFLQAALYLNSLISSVPFCGV